MRGGAIVLALAALALTGCGGGGDNDKAAARAVAQEYLDALRHGDGAAACRLMSAKAMSDGGYATLKQCAKDHSHARSLGRFHVVRVQMQKGGRSATAEVNDAKVSDSGNDSIGLGRYGSRWLIDAD